MCHEHHDCDQNPAVSITRCACTNIWMHQLGLGTNSWMHQLGNGTNIWMHQLGNGTNIWTHQLGLSTNIWTQRWAFVQTSECLSWASVQTSECISWAMVQTSEIFKCTSRALVQLLIKGHKGYKDGLQPKNLADGIFLSVGQFLVQARAASRASCCYTTSQGLWCAA